MAKSNRDRQRTGKTPVYKRIAAALREDIESKGLKPHDRLASQQELCNRFSVSPITAEWALKLLDKENLIYRIRGKGTFVAPRRKSLRKEIRVGVVGHLHTDWELNSYARNVYRAVQIRAQEKACYVRFLERETDYASVLDEGEVDGLLILNPLQQNVAQLDKLDSVRHPYVVVGANWDGHPRVCADNTKAVRKLLDHLKVLGHTRIALLTDPTQARDTQERIQAFCDYLARRNWSIPPNRILNWHGWTIDGKSARNEVYRHFFNGSEDPTAVITLGGFFAGTMIGMLEERGLHVPERVSVATGMEQPPRDTPFANELTAMIQPIEQMGKRAMDELLKRIRKPQGPHKEMILLNATFRAGKTTAAAPEEA